MGAICRWILRKGADALPERRLSGGCVSICGASKQLGDGGAGDFLKTPAYSIYGPSVTFANNLQYDTKF